jgi:hypothetical protein
MGMGRRESPYLLAQLKWPWATREQEGHLSSWFLSPFSAQEPVFQNGIGDSCPPKVKTDNAHEN